VVVLANITVLGNLVSCNSPVTVGMGLLFDGPGHLLQAVCMSVGAGGVDGAAGLSSGAGGTRGDADPSAAASCMRTTLALGHLCFLAVLQELNFHLHATHCRL
jgi:hypothetical protein